LSQISPETGEEIMRLHYTILLRILVAIAGTIAFWWFVLPNSPAEAAADGITAGAVAGYAEIMISRFGG
jgi:hypothetical protein